VLAGVCCCWLVFCRCISCILFFLFPTSLYCKYFPEIGQVFYKFIETIENNLFFSPVNDDCYVGGSNPALWMCDWDIFFKNGLQLISVFFWFAYFFSVNNFDFFTRRICKNEGQALSVFFAHRFLNGKTKSWTNSLDIISHPFIRVIICSIICVCLAMKKKGSRLLLIIVSKDANIDTCWCMWNYSYCVNLKSDQSISLCYFWRKSLLKNILHTWAFLTISYITGYHGIHPEFLTLCGSLKILSWVAIFYTQFSTLFS
jgi:hypothetical protein